MRFCLLLILPLAAFASDGRGALVACLDEFPPYQMLETPPKGEHVAALAQLAEELDMELQFVTEPNFAHCMKRIEQGSADVIAGILDREERRHFLHLLPMRKDTAYIFATRNDAKPIEKYTDLHDRLIAVSEATYYFDQFDQDNSLQKVALNDVHHAYKLLLAGRVDTVISSMENLTAIFASDPGLKAHIQVQPFTHELNRIVYFGLSMQSRHAGQVNHIRAKAEKAFAAGKFEAVIHQFAAEHPQYYQVKPQGLGKAN
ncbi:transporter substrate-binding domain-containing protein [Bowmanella denitrificans]|uniref:Transporter substrate-binding domain-containing protein n=1 Tax=Bowmanella denitrificans TaxID=366582 RepID=A0ABN0XSE3_9ALTE